MIASLIPIRGKKDRQHNQAILRVPPMYSKQRAAICSPARYAIVEASTKAGKTFGCLIWLLSLAWVGTEGQNFWWIAPTYRVAHMAMRRMQRMLRRARVPFTANKVESSITLPGGGTMWFLGAENEDALYGEDVHAAVLDEATRVPEEAWWAVRTTLTATNGAVRIIGNVRGRKNWAYLLARRAEQGADGMSYGKLTAYDAVAGGVLSAAEIEDAKRTLPEHVFRELYLAEAGDDGGNPFGLDRIAACVAELSDAPAVAIGIDVAETCDYTAVVGLDRDKRGCLLTRFRGREWAAIEAELSAIIASHPEARVKGDATGVGKPIMESLARKHGNVELVQFGRTNRQGMLSQLAVAIAGGEIRFPDGWLRNELDSFGYEWKGGMLKYVVPQGMHDDGAFALGLAVMAYPSYADTFVGVLDMN